MSSSSPLAAMYPPVVTSVNSNPSNSITIPSLIQQRPTLTP
jgi:hypothetical protein